MSYAIRRPSGENCTRLNALQGGNPELNLTSGLAEPSWLLRSQISEARLALVTYAYWPPEGDQAGECSPREVASSVRGPDPSSPISTTSKSSAPEANAIRRPSGETAGSDSRLVVAVSGWILLVCVSSMYR